MNTTRTLNDIMEFDHVVEVRPDGSIIDRPDLHAPDLLDDQLSDPTTWAFFTTGYSGQDRYSGPIMHNSEFIGGGLERDIRETPGVYVAIVAYWSPEEDDDDDELYAEGWAVVTLAD